MATKKITELQLIAAVVDGLSVPGDNGIQTYRFTALQMLNYILGTGKVPATALADSIFADLTAVTIAPDDYVAIADTSDSNKKKKALIGTIKNAVYRSVVTTDAVATTDETMVLSGASFTSTLPTASGVAGKKYKYIHGGTSLTQVYTLATTSSQTIGGIASGSYKLCTNGEVLEIESDGSNWIILNHYAKTARALYTPTVDGLGTLANNSSYWYRDGQHLSVEANFDHGTLTGNSVYMKVPSGVVMDSAVMKTGGQYSLWGDWNGTTSSDNRMHGNSGSGYCMFDGTNTDTIWFTSNTSSAAFAKAAGSSAFVASQKSSVRFRVPVADWRP